MKLDNKGQTSIEWILILGALLAIVGIIIYLISNSAITQKVTTKNTIDQLNKTITDL